MSHPSGNLVRVMGIDDTAPSGERDDTVLSPAFRPDVLAGPEQRLQRRAIHAALFGGSSEAVSVGRFRLLNRLGAGGMGRVYAAFDEQLDRRIAVKLIRASALDSSEAVERTLREARALARVSHPNVVHVYEVGEIEGQLFVAMEFLAGPTLRTWLDEDTQRDWKEVLAVLRQAGEGLAAAHAEGIVHRDFKPQNLMFGADGRVRVLDFGLAAVAGGEPRATSDSVSRGLLRPSSLTVTGAVMGTPAYMAPEQLAGQPANVRSDIFGFCVTLFEALYGERPFGGRTLEELLDAASRGRITQPTPGTSVPPWLRKAVLRGLSADPSQRYASMPELLDALADDPALGRRKWWAAAAVVGLIGGGGWGIARAFDDAPDADELRAAAEVDALRASELLSQGQAVDALALAIRAASISSSQMIDEVLFEATAAELSWGLVAEYPGFPGVVSFSPDGTRFAHTSKRTFHGLDYHVIDVDGLELRSLDCLASELAFGADNSTLIARCYKSGDVHVWDTNTGGLISSFAGELAPEFSSDELDAPIIATRAQHGVELTRVTATPELVATLAHDRAPTMIEFSPDGSRVVTGGPDQDTRVWDTSTGALTAVLAGSNAVLSSFFVDGSDKLATVGTDQQVRIWALGSGELLAVLPTSLERAIEIADYHDLAISPDADRVALYLDRNIWVWNASTGELVAGIEDRAENPLDNDNPWVLHVSGPPLSFSRDGSRLATRRHDGGVHLLDSDSGATLANSQLALAYEFSPDGDLLAVGTGDAVEIWDSASGARVRSLPAAIPHITTFSPDGTRIAAPGEDDDGDWSLRVWQTSPSPSTITKIRGRIDSLAGVAVSADATRIVTVDHVVARVWDVASGAELETLTGHLGPITSISTPRSSAAPYLATASVDASVRVWDLRLGEQSRLLSGHKQPVRVVEFTHDGSILGSGSDDHTVRLWDPASATALGEPLEHPGPVTMLEFASTSDRVVTASGNAAYVWDVRSQALLAKLPHDAELGSVAIAPAGARVATHDGETIRLWDSSTGKLLGEWADSGRVPTVEFSPDGARLASSAGVWDVDSGRLVVELEGHDEIDRYSAPSPVSFSRDGALVAARGRVWNAHSGVLIGHFSDGHDEWVSTTAFLQAGARVLTASRDAVVIRDARPPLAVACERLRPFGPAYATVAAVCDPR